MNIRSALFFRLLCVLPFSLMSCGRSINRFQTAQSCSSNQAQILVFDGSMKTLCGCQEGVIQASSGTFSCTTTARNILFIFQGSTLTHNIVPASGLPIPGSGPVAAGSTNPVHAVTLPTSGTYGFQDLSTPGLIGTIIAI